MPGKGKQETGIQRLLRPDSGFFNPPEQIRGFLCGNQPKVPRWKLQLLVTGQVSHAGETCVMLHCGADQIIMVLPGDPVDQDTDNAVFLL